MRFNKEQRTLIRMDIQSLRDRINSGLTELRKIPDDIVQGKLEDIIAFKDACEKSVNLYHIKHPPGDTKTGKELTEIKQRLEGIANLVRV